MNVLEAAQERIAFCFDSFDRVCVSFSGGKDSSVMTHLALAEAARRGRKVGLFFIDLEAQYAHTIAHVSELFSLYAEHIEPFWCTLPILLRNAVSQFEPRWICWEPGREKDWVRPLPNYPVKTGADFPFFRYGMEFEEFVPQFGVWYGGGVSTCCLVGIRMAESLNRRRTIWSESKERFANKAWTTRMPGGVYNAYPIFDWKTEDIWTFFGKTRLPYNLLYDLMHKAGLSIHQMRICQPYGDDQRKGLWLFHRIEPETWARVVARVNGANAGSLYSQTSGNILGNIKVSKPAGITWQAFARLLLDSMPGHLCEHYENKIAVFLKWWRDRGYAEIPDELPLKQENAVSDRKPSWRRICRALLRNDYWCKGLSFSPTKSDAYEKYKILMKKRRAAWGL